MPARKNRIPVVVDTNVFIRNFKARSDSNPNRRVIRLWLLERRLQLIVSLEVVREYLEIFSVVMGMDAETIAQWGVRFEKDRRSTLVALARRYVESRDRDDNVLLATAMAGKAQYLITNDSDLLELPGDFKRTLPFSILTPRQFLGESEGSW